MPFQSLNLDLQPMSAIVRERDQRLKVEARSAQRRSRQRSYQAGRITRLNRDWPVAQISQRNEIYRSLRYMRARMRHLAQNSDHFKKFLSLVRNNVAGPFGLKLQVDSGSDNQNKLILDGFKTWSHKEFASSNGQLSLNMIRRRICTLWARDGEVLLRKVYGRNRFGYSLKFISVSWLDENWHLQLPNGHRIIMSVELDADDRPVAYWLTPPADTYSLGFLPSITQRTRVPAEEIFHLFLRDDENADGDDTQTRGVPWGHTAALTLFNLDLGDEANLFSMRAGASKMGFFEHEDGDEESGEDDDKGDDEDDDKPPLIDHFEPGTFWDLPPNTKFTAFDPQFPNQAHEPFARYELRRAATGFDVNYHSLTGDLENVNLSTIRFGIQDERTVWKSLQETLIETFERPNFIDWLRNSIAAGAVPVHPRNLELFNEPKFQGVRWPYMDPVKDVQSERLAIDGGLDTITDSLAEQGKDIRELFQTRKEELDLAKKLELPIESLSKFNAAGTFAQDEQQLQADQNAASSSSKKKTGK